MNAEHPGDSKTPEPACDKNPAPPRSFGDVARRIRSRTTDLLAIAVVLMGALAVGSKIQFWSKPDETAPELSPQQQGPILSWGADDTPVSIEFGDSPHRLNRATFSGDRIAAGKRLVAGCRLIVEQATRHAVLRKSAEQRMLKRLERYKPVETKGEIWRVYRFEGPVLMATAIRRFEDKSEAGKTAETTKGVDAKSPFRVVCWGLAFPAGEERWTLFTFQPSQTEASTSKTQKLVAVAPPNTQRVFSLRDDNGQTWLTFRGDGPLEDWMRFYDELALKRDWQSESNWRTSRNRAAAVFYLQTSGIRTRITVSFSGTPESGFTGTVIVTPPADTTQSR